TVERKASSLAWHYRSAEPELATIQANELLNELEEVLRRKPYAIVRGNKVIEVRHNTTSKGHATQELLALHADCDLVFCAGDDRTDEDMMSAIRDGAIPEHVLCWV